MRTHHPIQYSEQKEITKELRKSLQIQSQKSIDQAPPKYCRKSKSRVVMVGSSHHFMPTLDSAGVSARVSLEGRKRNKKPENCAGSFLLLVDEQETMLQGNYSLLAVPGARPVPTGRSERRPADAVTVRPAAARAGVVVVRSTSCPETSPVSISV